MPPVPRRRPRRDHLIVCGDNALACRVVEELTATYGEEVTVLLHSRTTGHGPRMAGLPRVRIIERAELDTDAFSADLVLAKADGAPRGPLSRPRRRLLRAVVQACRALFWHKFGIVFLALFAVLVLGFLLLAIAGGFSMANAAYLTFLDAAGAAVSNPDLSAPEKVAQVLLTFDGMAVLPVVTAAVVGARLTGSLRGKERHPRGAVRPARPQPAAVRGVKTWACPTPRHGVNLGAGLPWFW